jgi:hypothetical protein
MSHRYLYSVPSCHGQMRQAVHCGMYWQCGRLIILSSPMSLWNEYSTFPVPATARQEAIPFIFKDWTGVMGGSKETHLG